MQTLIKELKKNLDKQLQKQIDNLYEKYHVQTPDYQLNYTPITLPQTVREKITECAPLISVQRFDDSEKLCGQAPNRNEEQSKRLKDPVRKTVQQFMRIEGKRHSHL